jgi:hypothetical protein
MGGHAGVGAGPRSHVGAVHAARGRPGAAPLIGCQLGVRPACGMSGGRPAAIGGRNWESLNACVPSSAMDGGRLTVLSAEA